ncbi:MAG: ABC transporter ATP-binding protein [Proteobacteria bacterium]|nr:ABC transporter ATP-binding protein [Pseudomonadota bacterium]
MKDTIIELSKVTKIFSTDKMDTYALKNINLKIVQGDFISIEGESGSGKSTLLNILGVIANITSGQYFLKNRNISHLTDTQKAFIRNQFIGFIFQDFNLVDNLTVKQNIELPLLYRKNIGKKEKDKKIRKVLEKVNLINRIDHYPKQLSGGQQQRVAVARAIIGQPAIILADEPTGNLDKENGYNILKLLTKLNESGSTICMVTHNLKHRKFANRVLKIVDGELLSS